MQDFLEVCGYLGAYLGVFVEGEILFLTAIITAQLGYLNFWGILLAVFLGAQTSDWTFFLLGRIKGQEFVEKRPKLRAKMDKMSLHLEGHPNLILLSYRFLLGFRIVIPLMIGLSNISTKKFALFSVLSTGFWISVYGSFGYFCAEALLSNFQAAQQYRWEIITGLIIIGLSSKYFLRRREIRVEK